MHGNTHAQVTRLVLEAFEVKDDDIEEATQASVDLDVIHRAMGSATWITCHTYNEGANLFPQLEAGSVGPSNISTLKASFHLASTYSLLSFYAMPKKHAWQYLGFAYHVLEDLCTPFHVQFANVRNILESAFKDGAHSRFEGLLVEHGDEIKTDILTGIRAGLDAGVQLEDPANIVRALEDVILPEVVAWTAPRQEELHALYAQLNAGLGGVNEILCVGKKCAMKASYYCTVLAVLLNLKEK